MVVTRMCSPGKELVVEILSSRASTKSFPTTTTRESPSMQQNPCMFPGLISFRVTTKHSHARATCLHRPQRRLSHARCRRRPWPFASPPHPPTGLMGGDEDHINQPLCFKYSYQSCCPHYAYCMMMGYDPHAAWSLSILMRLNER